MTSGIYQILNIVNNKKYIGSSCKVIHRFNQHKHDLNKHKHKNAHLMNAWNKYGSSSFVFSVLEYCDIKQLEIREQYYLDSIPKNILYNKRNDATSNAGIKLPPISESHRAKLSGKTAWNKGTKGIGKRNSGSFKKGMVSWNKGKKMRHTHWLKGKKLPYTIWNKGKNGVWTGGGVKPAKFSLVSPNGIYYEGRGIRKFAEFMGLTTYLIQLVKGNIKTYKGWRLPNENEIYNGYGFFPTDNKIMVRN